MMDGWKNVAKRLKCLQCYTYTLKVILAPEIFMETLAYIIVVQVFGPHVLEEHTECRECMHDEYFYLCTALPSLT